MMHQFWNKSFFSIIGQKVSFHWAPLYIILSYENSSTYEHFWFFQVIKLWQLVTLQLFEAQVHVLHFWKPPIYICLEPDCQGDCSVLKVCQFMLKSWGLLNKLPYASDLLCTPLYYKLYVVHPVQFITTFLD